MRMKNLVYRNIESFVRSRNPLFTINRSISFFTLLRIVKKYAIRLLVGSLIKANGRIKGTGFVFVSNRVSIEGAPIGIGARTIIENGVRFKSLKHSIFFGKSCRIGMFSDIQTGTSFNDPCGFIRVGDNVAIGAYAHLGGAGGITIGQGTIIGQYLSMHSENHNFSNTDIPIRNQGVNRKGISIGKDTWVGSKVTFVDGSGIGDGCVVAAGAVVTKRFGDGVLIGGVPARIIKKI